MDLIKTSSESGILHLRLNRADQLNALSHDLLTQLLTLLVEAKKNSSIKAILLSGEGKAFCAGADIKQLAQLNGEQGVEFARYGQHVFNVLESLGKPSLAAIHGFALGGGCELAMAATLRIATHNTVFGQPEVNLGIIPGFGGTQRLPRLIGKGRALDICLRGRRFNGQEAFSWGLVNEITEPDNLLKRGSEILSELVKASPLALNHIMTVINQGYDLTLTSALELEAMHFGLCCSTADKREGVNAFLEKRAAVFSGE